MNREAWWATVHRVTKSQTQMNNGGTEHICTYIQPRSLSTCLLESLPSCIFTSSHTGSNITSLLKHTPFTFSIVHFLSTAIPISNPRKSPRLLPFFHNLSPAAHLHARITYMDPYPTSSTFHKIVIIMISNP